MEKDVYIGQNECSYCKTITLHLFSEESAKQYRGQKVMYFYRICLNCYHTRENTKAEYCRTPIEAWNEFVLTAND